MDTIDKRLDAQLLKLHGEFLGIDREDLTNQFVRAQYYSLVDKINLVENQFFVPAKTRPRGHLFDYVKSNSKVLALTGIVQSHLALKNRGLHQELIDDYNRIDQVAQETLNTMGTKYVESFQKLDLEGESLVYEFELRFNMLSLALDMTTLSMEFYNFQSEYDNGKLASYKRIQELTDSADAYLNNVSGERYNPVAGQLMDYVPMMKEMYLQIDANKKFLEPRV